MLALRTGWTPDVLADLPAVFRSACHWAIFAESVAGRDGLPQVEVSMKAPVEARIAAMKQSVALHAIRKVLFPADE